VFIFGGVMEIIFSVSSKKMFGRYYEEIFKGLSYSIEEDDIVFGISDSLVILVKIIYDSVISEMPYEILKTSILQIANRFIALKRKQDIITMKLYCKNNTYEIPISNEYNEVKIIIPHELSILLKK
jgi:hypothetical protein